MITVRKSSERGHADYGWLKTFHTFSFGNYYDPNFMGFRSLRVINEDFVAAGRGFPTHAHDNMEIVTYVVEGALAHKDSTGGEETLRPHEVQRMTAGSGIRHSEFNPSSEEATHLLQIWLLPDTRDLEPSYEQTYFAPAEKQGALRVVAARDGREGSVKINQDVSLYSSLLANGDAVTHNFAPNRHGWLQLIKGSLEVGGQTLKAGDGAAISDVTSLEIKANADSEFLLFDLA